MIWYKEKNNDDIIISTRVRLARNLKNYPFPALLSEAGAKQATDIIEKAILDSNSTLAKEFEIYHISDIGAVDKKMLFEKHLISPDLLKKPNASVMLSKDDHMSIMLMEEDHIRLQVILGGFKPDEAYELANRVDDVIDENVQYAFDADFGYLTSCPTNTGTGLRASVMMHLPALTLTNNIQKIISSAGNLGIAVRGLYGEGSNADGCLYQISNQVTLGISEKNAIENLKTITGQIIKKEEKSAELPDKTKLQDVVFRSYGLLSNARLLTNDELLGNLSNVILGERLGIIKNMNNVNFALMFKTQPATLSLAVGNSENLDYKRAEIVRNTLS